MAPLEKDYTQRSSSGDNKNRPKFRLLGPEIRIPKPQTPIIFIDTFFWKFGIDLDSPLADELHRACSSGIVKVVLSDVVIGELTARNLCDKVEKICQDRYCIAHSMHITANQIIQALCRFMHRQRVIYLPWDLVATEPAVIGKGLQGLRDIVDTIAMELNKLRSSPEAKSKESLVSGLVHVDREAWRDILKIYGDILCEETESPAERYEDFFWTDFFTDLPAIVLSAYLLAYTLYEKELRINDIVDIFTLAELLPYVALYITDRDLFARFNRVAHDYPEVFFRYQTRCQVISGLEASTQALREFLEGLQT